MQTADAVPIEKTTDNVVDLQNVKFSYPARSDVPVLKGISLKVRQGQTVGVVGTSGSGKSTLLALLERFYDAQSGAVNVFGRPITAQNLDEYRKRLALVPQEPQLYKGEFRLAELERLIPCRLPTNIIHRFYP